MLDRIKIDEITSTLPTVALRRSAVNSLDSLYSIDPDLRPNFVGVEVCGATEPFIEAAWAAWFEDDSWSRPGITCNRAELELRNLVPEAYERFPGSLWNVWMEADGDEPSFYFDSFNRDLMRCIQRMDLPNFDNENRSLERWGSIGKFKRIGRRKKGGLETVRLEFSVDPKDIDDVELSWKQASRARLQRLSEVLVSLEVSELSGFDVLAIGIDANQGAEFLYDHFSSSNEGISNIVQRSLRQILKLNFDSHMLEKSRDAGSMELVHVKLGVGKLDNIVKAYYGCAVNGPT